MYGLVGIVYQPSLGQSAALWRGCMDWIGRYCVSTFSRIVGCFVERYGLVVIVYPPLLGQSADL